MLIDSARPFALASLLGSAHQPGGPAPPLWRVVSDPRGVAVLYRHLGEFCHTFRNRLNSLQLCFYLANPDSDGDSGAWGRAEAAYRDVLRRIEFLQEICRPIRLDVMRFPLGLLMADFSERWTGRFSARGLGLRTRLFGDDEGDFDPMRLSHGLEAIASWRLAAAARGTIVVFACGVSGDEMWIAWDESAPEGIADGSAQGPSGFLPLALAARIVAEHGGRMSVAEGPSLSFSLRWPRQMTSALRGGDRAGDVGGVEELADEAAVPAGRP